MFILVFLVTERDRGVDGRLLRGPHESAALNSLIKDAATIITTTPASGMPRSTCRNYSYNLGLQPLFKCKFKCGLQLPTLRDKKRWVGGLVGRWVGEWVTNNRQLAYNDPLWTSKRPN